MVQCFCFLPATVNWLGSSLDHSTPRIKSFPKCTNCNDPCGIVRFSGVFFSFFFFNFFFIFFLPRYVQGGNCIFKFLP